MLQITPASSQAVGALVWASYGYVYHLILFKGLFANEARITSIILALS